jgi:hypothetical protein
MGEEGATAQGGKCKLSAILQDCFYCHYHYQHCLCQDGIAWKAVITLIASK